MLVCSSTHKTTSALRSLRVYRPHNWRTVAANASSRGTLGESHIWCRHGLRRWCRRICRTDSTEMLGTTPSRTNARAISAQSHCDRDRPRRSGRSQASLTACTATAGGKGGLTSAAGSVLQALEALGQEPLDPLADVLLGQADLACGPNEGQAVGDGQDRPAAAGQTQRRCGAPEPVLQVMTLFGGEDDHQLRRAATHDDPPVADRAVPLPPRSTEVGRTSRVTISGPQLLGALLSLGGPEVLQDDGLVQGEADEATALAPMPPVPVDPDDAPLPEPRREFRGPLVPGRLLDAGGPPIAIQLAATHAV